MKKETFKEIIETDHSILLLDIREPEELLIEETIPGAKNVPMGKVFTEAIKGNLPKDVQIIVFCRTGGRAGVVERELCERGYLIDGLEGGLEALRET
ncbi:pyridine nucleotide-disulfide oxidoreductase [bacterium]|nr:pyridine nucleotide-disulfide oxidoreductase [bacterium]|tara:strand:+ start:189 stop:479 length:291 start_codon:yes stop_codon:yes gene_type:complete